MKRKTVQTKCDVPVRQAFRWDSNNHVQLKLPWLLESQLHGSQRKSYLSAPFFFHLRYGWLVRGRLYMPGQRYELHHKIYNLRYGTPGYGMSAYKGRWRQNAVILDVLWFANHKRAHLSEFHLWVLPLVFWIDGFSQPGYCMPHSLGQIKNRTDLFSGFWERPVLRKQTLRFQKPM